MNYFKLFIFLMAALCVVSVSCAANQADAGADAAQLDEHAANDAIKAAEGVITKATEKASTVLQSAITTQTEACGLEDEKNKATNAKSEAEKLATDVNKADDTKKKVTDAVSEAEEKFKDLCTKAGNAFTKATKADGDAKEAKEALETAKTTEKDSTGGTYKDRIEKVKAEETKANKVEKEAIEIEKEVDEIVKCISEFKTSVQNAQIGLSEIKVFVEVDKAKKSI